MQRRGDPFRRAAMLLAALSLGVLSILPASAQNYVTPVGEALVAEIENFRDQLAYAERTGDDDSAGAAHLLLAQLYYSRVVDPDASHHVDGDLDSAIENWNAGLLIRRKLGRQPSDDWTDYFNLSAALLLRADGAQTMDLANAIEIAEQLYESTSPSDNFLTWRSGLEILFRALRASQDPGDIERAITLGEEALEKAGPLIQLPVVNSIKADIGGLYLSRKHGALADNRMRALALYQSALAGLGPEPLDDGLRTSYEVIIAKLQADRSSASAQPTEAYEPGKGAQSCRDIVTDVDSFLRTAKSQSSGQGRLRDMAATCTTEADGAASSIEAGQYQLVAAQVQLELAGRALDPESVEVHLRQSLAQLDLAAANFNYPSASTEAAGLQMLRSLIASLSDKETASGDPGDFELLIQRGGTVDRMNAGSAQAVIDYQSGEWDASGRVAEQTADFVEQQIGIGLNEQETRLLLDGSETLYRLGARAWVRAGQPARALTFLDRGRAQTLAASLQMDRLELSPKDRTALTDLRIQIAALSDELSRAEAPSLEAINALDALRASSEKIVSGATGGQVAVPSGIVLVAPIFFDGVSILVQTPDASAAAYAAPDVDERILERAVADWSARLRGGSVSAGTMSAALSEFERGAGPLGEAIGRALTSAGVQAGSRVVLLTDGRMSVLPVHLLRFRGERLGDIYEMSLSPSMEMLAATQSRAAHQPPPSLVSFANPSGDPGLKHAASEANLVAKMFAPDRRKIVTAADAELSRPDRAIGELVGRSYWHFSTHGVFDWNVPVDSGLLFANEGVLRVGEIRSAGGGLFRPRLVVLSACETGLSDPARAPNEFQGLPAAFLQAGAAGVIGSLWPVSDLASALLIARVYELHLGNQALPPSAALKQAQAWLRQASRQDLQDYVLSREDALGADAVDAMLGDLADLDGDAPLADPFYWGAWVYFGA